MTISVKAPAVPISEPPDSNGRQWAQLVPSGVVKTRDTRGPYYVNNKEEIIRRSFAGAANGQIPIDYNHAIDRAAPKGQPSPATGWILEMQSRPDGIWGLIEWTPSALKAVRDREYRFLSPVIAVTAGNEAVAILRASLTNDPNFTMVALNAAERETSMDTEELLAELRKALGLDETADADAILAKVKASLESANNVDPSKFVPFETFANTVAELNRVNSGISLHAAERAVDEAIEQMTLMPFMRNWAIDLCTANKPAFDGFVAKMGKQVHQMFAPSGIHQRYALERNKVVYDDIQKNMGLSAQDVAKYGKETD